MSLFPPSNKFYNLIRLENFKQFLSVDGTTEDGQNTIAQHYSILDARISFMDISLFLT
jgi:hypothetical protein